MDVPVEDDDPFEAQREATDSPMRRLFATYGRDNLGYFLVGLVGSVAARVLDLLPPLLLGYALDAVVRDDKAFGAPFVPDAWLPGTREGQLVLVASVIAVTFVGGAVFHWFRN